ncbi:MAG: hypothetical protein IT364_12935 [Candidatus Hydrogenedentes bacterium]|nr:hypothetical protein [Candidatus Hydrogenedentota bacterium]
MPQVWELVKEMTQPTRRRSPKSVEQVAHELRVSPVLLYKWGEPGDKHKFPAELAAPLFEAVDRDPLLIEFLCSEHGGVFVPFATHGMRTESIGAAIREFGEFVSEMGASLDDGEITAEELARIEREGAEAVVAIETIIMEARNRAINTRKRRNAS